MHNAIDNYGSKNKRNYNVAGRVPEVVEEEIQAVYRIADIKDVRAALLARSPRRLRGIGPLYRLGPSPPTNSRVQRWHLDSLPPRRRPPHLVVIDDARVLR